MARRLWMEEDDGERWLTNPSLLIANPRKRRKVKKMAKRRQPAALARYWAAHRRGKKAAPKRKKARRSAAARSGYKTRKAARRGPSVVVLTNPRKRRGSYVKNRPRKKGKSRRPSMSLGGFSFPSINSIAFVGAGMVIPPMVARLMMPYLPATWQTSKVAAYGVKVASAVIPAWLVRKFISRDAGNLMLLGSAASIVVSIVQDSGVLTAIGIGPMPAVGVSGITQPFLGQYVPERGLGRYIGPGTLSHGAPLTAQDILQGVPERSNPMFRN